MTKLNKPEVNLKDNQVTTSNEIVSKDIKIESNLKVKRILDILKLIPTYLSSIFIVLVLGGIIIYILMTGSSAFSLNLLFDDYQEVLNTITVEYDSNLTFTNPNIEGSYFVERFGITIADSVDTANEDCVIVTWIANNSPLKNATKTNGDGTYTVEVGDRLDTIRYKNDNNVTQVTAANKGAERVAEALNSATIINQMQCKTGGGGARGSLITTLYLILLTLIISLPIGIISSIFLTQYAKEGKIKTIITTMIDMTSGIPSIIFGFCGAIIFIPFCDTTFNTSGYSILAGAFTMTIVLLPTIIKTVSESLLVIPRSYTMASLALGASKTQTVFKVILPNAIPGILTATLLSIGRIIGESAALIFVMGTSIQDHISVTGSSSSLAVHIWTIINQENPNYEAASAIGIFILIVVLILSLLIKLISKKLNKMAV